MNIMGDSFIITLAMNHLPFWLGYAYLCMCISLSIFLPPVVYYWINNEECGI